MAGGQPKRERLIQSLPWDLGNEWCEVRSIPAARHASTSQLARAETLGQGDVGIGRGPEFASLLVVEGQDMRK